MSEGHYICSYMHNKLNYVPDLRKVMVGINSTLAVAHHRCYDGDLLNREPTHDD